MTMEFDLLRIADSYEREARGKGRSLSRIATIVANRGSFFSALRRGQTCSVRNFDRFLTFFADASNWPSGFVASDAEAALKRLGREIANPRQSHVF